MKYLSFFLLSILLLASCTISTDQNTEDSDAISSNDSLSADSLSMSFDSAKTSIVKHDSTAKDSSHRQYIEGAFTVPAAMEVIYGLYDKEIECSKWICKPVEKKQFAGKSDASGTLHTRAAGAYPIETSEGKKMLLLTETLSREKGGWENCHACAPILGAAMFHEIDGAWFIEALKKDLDVIGAWGELPSNKLVKFGPEMYGVLFSYGSTGQGITEGGIELVGVINGKFSILLDAHTDFSNEGMFPDPKSEPMAYSYSSNLTFRELEGDNPFQLILTRKGERPYPTEGGGEIVKPFSEQLIYEVSKGKYQLVDSILGN